MLNSGSLRRTLCAAFLLAFPLAAPPALAQDARGRASSPELARDGGDADDQQAQPSPPVVENQRPGRVAGSAVGLVGQRQTRGQTIGGVTPMARIDNRIRNRVQSRIRNRIDRDYDPQANAASPFEVAGDEARAASKPGR